MEKNNILKPEISEIKKHTEYSKLNAGNAAYRKIQTATKSALMAVILSQSNAAHSANNENEIHHSLKTGATMSLVSTRELGMESSWTYHPTHHHHSLAHFIFTPVDVVFSQHSSTIVNQNDMVRKKQLQYFAGSLAGVALCPHQKLEVEIEAGLGAGFFPSYKKGEQSNYYHLDYHTAPVGKIDFQIQFLPGANLRTFIGYSPEITLIKVPVEQVNSERKSYHLNHIGIMGMGYDF